MLLKKIDKEADEKAKDEKIAKHILKKDSKEDEIQLLKQEIESLKKGDKTETLSKNMVLIGKVVDSLVEDNNAYKKRKEEKKKKKGGDKKKKEKENTLPINVVEIMMTLSTVNHVILMHHVKKMKLKRYLNQMKMKILKIPPNPLD